MRNLILTLLISSFSFAAISDPRGIVVRSGDKLACYHDSKEVPCIFMWTPSANGPLCNLVTERREIYPGYIMGLENGYCQAVVK